MRSGPREIMPRGGRLDRAPRTEAELDAVQDTAITFFTDLKNANEHVVGRFGAASIDYSPLLQRLESSRRSRTLPNSLALHDLLFEEGVPPAVLQKLADKMPEHVQFKAGLPHIRERFFGEGLLAEVQLDCRSGGDSWLREFMNNQLRHKHIDVDIAHDVYMLGRSAAATGRYGNIASPMTRLMFTCAADTISDSRRRQHAVPSRETIDRLAAARGAEARVREQIEGNFFEQMHNFFSVYADITASVLQRSKEDVKPAIDRAAKQVLGRFLQSPEFQIAQWNPDQEPPDPFDVFRALLLRKEDTNPWVVEDCTDTPFDKSRFGLLISEDVPRGLVADAVLFLNNYRATLLAQKSAGLLQSIQRRQEQGGDISERLRARIAERLEEIRQLSGRRAQLPTDRNEQIQMLSDFVASNTIFPRQGSEGIHPFSVLLRTVNSEKVLTDELTRQEFLPLLKEIPRAVQLEKDQSGTLSARGQRDMAIVASSVKEFLGTADPHLDVPLVGVESDVSIRMLIHDYARRDWFDEATLARGPYAHLVARGRMSQEALLAPRDLTSMSEDDIVRLKRNFNTAAGVDTHSKREWIGNATALWNDLPNGYNNILSYTHRTSERYYEAGKDYSLAFYPSATAAMNDVVHRLFEPIAQGDPENNQRPDCIVISHQEYAGMTDAFTNHGAEVLAIRTNDRSNKRALSANAIADSIVHEIESRSDGKLPRAILLSSKTRFGDAIGLAGSEKGPNAAGLGDLITLLKQRYPLIPIIVDGAQSVGRNDRAETLKRLGCDIYLNSGAKALGIENVALLALKKPPETGDHWLSHVKDDEVLRNPVAKLSVGKSTIDIRRVAALGMALQLQMQRGDSWKEGNDTEDRRTQRERIAEHMQIMTRHAIDAADRYAEALFTNPGFPFEVPDEIAANPDVRRQFGCQVVYPVHRKSVDFNGMLTVTFPNLGPLREQGEEVVPRNYVKTALQREGFSVEQCLAGSNGVRISFHYLHEEEDINKLFAAIERIHIDFLSRQIERRGIQSFADLQRLTPNTPDDWMED